MIKLNKPVWLPQIIQMNVVMEMFATILDVQVQSLPVDLSICGVCSMRLPREAIHHCLIISQLPRPTHHSLLLHIVHIPPPAYPAYSAYSA